MEIFYFSCTKELSIYLIDNHLINAVSEAVILSTLSYQEAWEMVISLFLNTCPHYYFSAFLMLSMATQQLVGSCMMCSRGSCKERMFATFKVFG